MRRGYTKEMGFFLGSAFWESIPKFGGVVLPVKRLDLDSPKKRPTVGRRKNLLWVVDATYGRSSSRPTVGLFFAPQENRLRRVVLEALLLPSDD